MWTRRDLVRVVTAASAAFGLTLAAFWSSPIHAVDGTPAEKTIAMPVYKDGACEVSAKLTAADGILGTRQALTFIKPGTVPAMQLTVHNTSHEPITSQFKVALNQTTMRDRMSRVSRPQPTAWSKDYEISLAPDETKTIDVDCGELKTAVNDSMMLSIGSAPAAPSTNGVTLLGNQSANLNAPPAQNGTLVLNSFNVVNNRVNLLQMSVAEKMPEAQTASSGITY